MSEQNNVSTQKKDQNPVAMGCGCIFVAIVLLHTFLPGIKRIIEWLFDE